MSQFNLPTLPDLLEAGVHFGHQSRRWHPQAARFIFTKKSGIHIVDLAQTAKALEEACSFLYQTAKSGEPIIFVGTKRQARDIVAEAAKKCGAFQVTERWLGGTLTNFEEIEKNLIKLRNLKKNLKEGAFATYTKLERRKIEQQIEKLEKLVGGIAQLNRKPGALFVVDIKREKTAVKEAATTGVPVVAIVDTNSDPTQVTHPIPGNDDAIRSVELLVSVVAEAVQKGYQEAGVNLEVLAVESLGLSSRVTRALKAAGIANLNQLQSKSEAELAQIKGLGPKSLTEIGKVLAKKGAS